MEVAFALTSCGVALAPTEGGGRGAADSNIGAHVTRCRFEWQPKRFNDMNDLLSRKVSDPGSPEPMSPSPP